MIAIEEKIASDVRQNVGEEGQHKDFRIVEDMTAIAKAGKAFGGDAVAAVMRGDVDTQLIEVETHTELGFVITLDDDICSLPVVLPGSFVQCQQAVVDAMSGMGFA